MTLRWLQLRLSAPLSAFGDVAIDHVGRTRAFPSTSALTGLAANALGLRRQDTAAHQALQDALVFGALIARAGRPLTDMQNAKLEKADKGWTTWGIRAERGGDSYESPHRRPRDYLADHDCRVVMRFSTTSDLVPDLDTLAVAFDRPARPLFIGRKSCLPTCRLFAGWVEGATARDALAGLGLVGRGQWPEETAAALPDTLIEVADRRNWRTGFHGGRRRLVEGDLT
jgi:CRISPR system Cascade subunit CasD